MLSGVTDKRTLADPPISTATIKSNKRLRDVNPNQYDAGDLGPGAKRNRGGAGSGEVIDGTTVVENYPNGIEVETLYDENDVPVYAAERVNGELATEIFYDEFGEISHYAVYEPLTLDQLEYELYDGMAGPVPPAGDYHKKTIFEKAPDGAFVRTDTLITVRETSLDGTVESPVQTTSYDPDTGNRVARNHYDFEGSGALYKRTEYSADGSYWEGSFVEIETARPGSIMTDWSYQWDGSVYRYSEDGTQVGRADHEAVVIDGEN